MFLVLFFGSFSYLFVCSLYSGLFLFYFVVIILDTFLFSNEKEKGSGFGWVGSGRSWRRGNCDQNILCEENNLFSIKIKMNAVSPCPRMRLLLV